MKKFVSILLAVVMVISLSACGTSNKPADQSKEQSKAEEKKATEDNKPAAEKKKISLWHIQVAKSTGEVVNDAVARFMKDNPDVEVENVASENDPYKTKLKVAMGSGNPPDVFHSWGGGWLEAFVKEGMVEDITADLDKGGWRDTFYQAYLDMAKFNGKNYGVPAEMSSVLVYYNKELFKKYNIEVPKTYEEFKKAIKTLKDNNIIPIAIGNKSRWPGALTFIYLSMRIGGYDVFQNAYQRKPGFTFEDPSFIEAGKKIQELVDMGAYPEGMNGINYDTGGSRMLIYTGKAAMIIQTSGFLSFAKSEAPDFFNNNLGFFPFPAVEGGKGDPTDIVGGVNAYSVSSKTKHRDAAVTLLKYLSDKTYGQMMTDNAARLSPVHGIEIKDPMQKELAAILSKAKHVQLYYDQFLPPELGELHKDTTQALFGKTITPEEAAKKMEEKAKQVFGK
ncbi:extracellular solute-binding protein [Petroclostridium xylanilyticum]|uniref:extracellular solute-binding protein n=1 Tax=Petroclostridium xylanilyticum TaxID=1792311 RepID=UPI000B997A77|nr:extracellular solute-binding protein [Petroclostridium xylanilyticum]